MDPILSQVMLQNAIAQHAQLQQHDQLQQQEGAAAAYSNYYAMQQQQQQQQQAPQTPYDVGNDGSLAFADASAQQQYQSAILTATPTGYNLGTYYGLPINPKRKGRPPGSGKKAPAAAKKGKKRRDDYESEDFGSDEDSNLDDDAEEMMLQKNLLEMSETRPKRKAAAGAEKLLAKSMHVESEEEDDEDDLIIPGEPGSNRKKKSASSAEGGGEGGEGRENGGGGGGGAASAERERKPRKPRRESAKPKIDFFTPPNAFVVDGICAVCNNGEGEEGNDIILCDSCDIAVHQACYGVTVIPEGDWFCARCAAGKKDERCVLCPIRYGAMKPTTDGRFAHLCCTIWIPETHVLDDLKAEPVAGINEIPKDRFDLRCRVCGTKDGACMQCDYGVCTASFHASCAMLPNTRVELVVTSDGQGVSKRVRCPQHIGLDDLHYKQQVLASRNRKRPKHEEEEEEVELPLEEEDEEEEASEDDGSVRGGRK